MIDNSILEKSEINEWELNNSIRKREKEEFKESLKKFERDNKKEVPIKNIKTNKGISGLKLLKYKTKRLTPKRTIRPSRITIRIKEQEPSPYVSRFFKNEVEEVKNNLFFK